jgi:uncharacterized protein (TIGR02145 family)
MKNINRFWFHSSRLTGFLLILLISCVKEDDNKSVPLLTTSFINNITTTTAQVQYTLKNTSGEKITERGVCWSLAANPTTALDTRTSDHIGIWSGAGTFTSSVKGLAANNIYYVRAYATNSSGTAYGNEIMFKTYSGTVTDIDGNIYNTVNIGTQVWMVENLKTTKYLNGDLIRTTTQDITGETTPKYQWAYNNSEGFVSTYGRLYTWFAVTDSRKICPAGWHLPGNKEWNVLVNYLGGESKGGELQSAGPIDEGSGLWYESTTYATNKSGFTALPSGYRNPDGEFYYLGLYCYLWDSTDVDVKNARLMQISSYIQRASCPKQFGLAIRCLKDN